MTTLAKRIIAPYPGTYNYDTALMCRQMLTRIGSAGMQSLYVNSIDEIRRLHSKPWAEDFECNGDFATSCRY
jgi:hypothetical protein